MRAGVDELGGLPGTRPDFVDERRWRALQLHAARGLSFVDIAEKLGGSVALQRQRAVEALRRLRVGAAVPDPYGPGRALAGEPGRIDEEDGALLCHVCGERFPFLSLHARRAHGLGPREYRRAFGLPRGAKLVGTSLSEERSALSLTHNGSKAGREKIALLREDPSFREETRRKISESLGGARTETRVCASCGAGFEALARSARLSCSDACHEDLLRRKERRKAARSRRRPADSAAYDAEGTSGPGAAPAPFARLLACAPDDDPVSAYLATLGPGSRRSIRKALDNVAGILTGGVRDALSLPWSSLRAEHTSFVRQELRRRYSPNTANKALASMGRVLDECLRRGGMTEEDHAGARRHTSGFPKKPSSQGRVLSTEELALLLRSCASAQLPRTGRRDAAIIALLVGCGLRSAELVALELTDYDPARPALRTGAAGDAGARFFALEPGVAAPLRSWLAERGERPGPLICSSTAAGEGEPRALTTQAVWYALDRRGLEAGIRLSNHDTRATHADAVARSGGDPAAAQRLVGRCYEATGGGLESATGLSDNSERTRSHTRGGNNG